MKHIARRAPVMLATFATACLLAFSAVLSQPYAQSGGGYSGGGSQQFSLPGFSSVGSTSGATTLFEVDFNMNAGFDMGCGGIGLMDFMSATFDLGNIVDQFKGSLNTMLSKALVTFAMSSPQIASLFDTLNAFGNARFDMFQQSCDINSIRQEVRDKAQKICVDKKKGEGMSAAAAESSCSSNIAQDALNQATIIMGKFLRESENVSEFVRGSVCAGNDGKYNPNTMGCAIMGMMPQVKMCLRAEIGEDCTTEGYGARDPAITVGTMADSAAQAGGRVLGAINNFNNSPAMAAATSAEKRQAAMLAILRLQNGDMPEGYTPPAEETNETTQKLLDEFRSQISCPTQEDPFILPMLYQEELVKLGVNVPDINTTVDLSDIEQYLSSRIVGAMEQVNTNDAEGIKKLLRLGTNCYINRMGLADPNVLMTLSNAEPGDAASYIQRQAEEVGHLLSINIASFIIKKLQAQSVTLMVDQAVRPATAQAQEAAAGGQDPAAFEPETPENMDMSGPSEQLGAGVQAMIDRLEQDIENENSRYEQQRNAQENRVRLDAISRKIATSRLDAYGSGYFYRPR